VTDGWREKSQRATAASAYAQRGERLGQQIRRVAANATAMNTRHQQRHKGSARTKLRGRIAARQRQLAVVSGVRRFHRSASVACEVGDENARTPAAGSGLLGKRRRLDRHG